MLTSQAHLRDPLLPSVHSVAAPLPTRNSASRKGGEDINTWNRYWEAKRWMTNVLLRARQALKLNRKAFPSAPESNA